MLTRIEIDGFKTFSGFALDLEPLTVIAGPNAVGKSNLFDAIRLLARLAEDDLRSSFSEGRGTADDQFRRTRRDGEARMTFAAEVLLPATTRDPFGQEHELTHTRVRYELEIEQRIDPQGVVRIYVTREDVLPIQRSEDAWAARAKGAGAFRYHRRKPFLRTDLGTLTPTFDVHQDGHQGRKQRRPAAEAEATNLSSIKTTEFKHLFALREELRSWRFLQFEPTTLGLPARRDAPPLLEPNGRNLPAVLARIQGETADAEDPAGALTDIAVDLRRVIPNARAVRIRDDTPGHQWELVLDTHGEPDTPGRLASDGTLRLLGLLTALHDPRFAGLICIEEPENGVEPYRLEPLLDVLRGLVTDPTRPSDLPMVQLLLATHSPVIVGLLSGDEALDAFEGRYFDLATPSGEPARQRTRSRAIAIRSQLTLEPADVGEIVVDDARHRLAQELV